MEMKKLFSCCIASGVLLAGSAFAGETSSLRVFPYIADPGIAIDGKLDDWGRIANSMKLTSKAQVKNGNETWKGTADLSGKFWSGWREEGLYLAAKITDDKFFVNHSANDNWKSDHVEFYLDMEPDWDRMRTAMGEGQYSFMFLPPQFGNASSKPQLFVLSPENLKVYNAQVAASRTDDGYILEVFLPAAIFGEKYFTEGRHFRCEVAFSDCDTVEPTQQRYMIGSTGEWPRVKRDLLVDSVLGNTAGEGKMPVKSIDLPEKSFTIIPGKEHSITFVKPEIPAGKQLVVRFRGRVDLKNHRNYRCSGYAQKSVMVYCNGKALEAKRLRNRTATSTRKNGGRWTFVMPSGMITLPYAMDFDAADKHSSYGLIDCAEIHAFELDITDLVKAGNNVITFKTTGDPSGERTGYIFDQAQLRFIDPPKVKVRRAAPKGKLPMISPKKVPVKPQYTVKENAAKNTIGITVNGENYTVSSRFSTPDGKWQNAGNKYFSLKRSLKPMTEAVMVTDTVKNLTNDYLPVRVEYSVDFGKRLKSARVGGFEPYGLNGENSSTLNPTSFGSSGKSGIGLLPWSEAFSVHIINRVQNNVITIADHNLVLPPNGEHKVESLIVPVPDGDFWSFVNSVRRVANTNYTLKYLFAEVVNKSKTPNKEIKERIANAIGNKKGNLMNGHNMWPMYKQSNGEYQYAWGTAWGRIDHTGNKNLFKYIKEKYPNVRTSLYFHCFLDPSDNAPKDYAENQILKDDGTPAVYGRFGVMFCPRIGTAYANELKRILDMIFNDLGCDNIYWDEFAVSNAQYTYNEPWDGVSGDISSSGKLVRRKSSVRLLSLPWRMEMVKYILSRGDIYTSGNFMLKHAGKFKMQNFVETAAISYCLQTILVSPVALGNHLGERNQIDCYRWMLAALDYGCLYAYYSGRILFAYPTLSEHMYPATPVELHKGYIICQERIITKESGVFGWNDSSKHEVHVYNEIGREVKNFAAPQRTINGCTWTELRLPEDYSAAIIRR